MRPVRDEQPAAGNLRRLIVLEDRPRRAPRAPATLAGRERELWRELMREPVAATWTKNDARLVVRLAGLLARLELEGAAAPASTHGIVLGLEDRLALNPRARRAAGIVLVPPTPDAGPAVVRELDPNRRRRLARGD
jgi:hypothetical protein